MGLLAGALILGAGLQIYGNRKANKAQRRAAQANAAMIAEQQRLAAMANRRDADIFLSESNALLGTQVSGLAKAGVDFSGSALRGLISSAGKQAREYNAILATGQGQAKIASIRQQQALKQAEYYGSSQLEFIQTAGVLLNGATSYMSAKASSGDYGNTGTRSSSSWPGTEVGAD